MNSKLLRGTMNASAVVLIAAWLIVQFFTDRAGWLIVWAMCLFIMTGFMAFCDRLRGDEIDEAYEDARGVLDRGL